MPKKCLLITFNHRRATVCHHRRPPEGKRNAPRFSSKDKATLCSIEIGLLLKNVGDFLGVPFVCSLTLPTASLDEILYIRTRRSTSGDGDAEQLLPFPSSQPRQGKAPPPSSSSSIARKFWGAPFSVLRLLRVLPKIHASHRPLLVTFETTASLDL